MFKNFFRRCMRLSLVVKKVRLLTTPAEFIRKLAETCESPGVLNCSPTIFPGLPKHELALLKRSIKSCSSFSYLEYAIHATHTILSRGAEALEKVQKLALKFVKGFWHAPYEAAHLNTGESEKI